jgi:hypothetical protein
MMFGMTLIIIGPILAIVSLVISYFWTTWRKFVLIIGITGAIVALIQGYRNQQRADDLQKQLSEARRSLPRMLADEQVTELLEGVRPFAGQEFTVGTYDEISESINIKIVFTTHYDQRIGNTINIIHFLDQTESANYQLSKINLDFMSYRLLLCTLVFRSMLNRMQKKKQKMRQKH